MIIRRQDLSVLLFHYLGYSSIKNLFLRLHQNSVGRFVMFHDLQPMALGHFKANLQFLKQKTNVVSLDEFFAGKLTWGKINVVITFDDGYKGWVTHAVPILKAFEMPATFFVSSGFVGLSEKAEAKYARSNLFKKLGSRQITGCLSCEDLRRIAGEGFTIGGHTVNHCNLAESRDRSEVQFEIAEDKKRLETITGVNVKYFSYPSGDYSNPVINLTNVLKAAGYIGAVGTDPGFNSIMMSPYHLHRETTRASMPLRIFRARVYGNYDAVRFIKQRVFKVFQ